MEGERGPKGDHGQHGDTGLEGRRGERGPKGDAGADAPARPDHSPGPLSKAFLVGLTLASVAAFLLGAFATGPSQAEVDAQVQDQVGDALVSNCQSNLAFRKQNLKRSRAAVKSYKYEQQANEQLIEVINLSIAAEAAATGATPAPLVKLGKALDRQNAKLGDLRESFKVVPLPECEELRELVENGASN